MNSTETQRDEVRIDTRLAEISLEIHHQNQRSDYAHKVLSANYSQPQYIIDRANETLADVDRQTAQLAEEAAPLNAEFDAKRWSRFFLVQGGHIHSSMSCSSCNKMGQLTRFGWLPELSGLTEADAVAAHGAILCTVCFPSAPVEWTNGHEEAAAAKRAAQCPGSGKYVAAEPGKRSRYVGCPECDHFGARTANGYVRAHKPKHN